MDFTNCTMRNRYELINSAPLSEYQDRVARLQAYMQENGIDVIIELDPALRGTGLWLYSDHHANAFAVKVDGSVIVEYRHVDLVEGYYIMHDGTVLEKPAYPGVEITPRLDFAAVCAGAKKVGFCHAGSTGEFADVTEATKQRMNTISADLVDVTKDVDTLKSVHSDFEVEMQFHTGKMIEKIIYAFPSICRLGRLYKDIETDLAAMITRLGSPGQFLLGHIGLLDSDGNSMISDNALPGRRAQNGDVVCLLVETNGPSNANAAGGRLYSFGKPTESLRRLNAMCIEATKFGGSLMFPGMPLDTVTRTVMDMVNSTSDYALPDYRFVHSLGYSEAEDPRANDTRPLVRNTPVICHPEIIRKDRKQNGMVRVFNTYVASEGGGKCIFNLPDEIIEL